MLIDFDWRRWAPLALIVAVLLLIGVPAVFFGFDFLTRLAPKAAVPAPAPQPLNWTAPGKKSASLSAAPAAAPAKTIVPTASLITAAPSASSSGLTRTGWAYLGSSAIDVIPAFDTGWRNLYLDFTSNNFANISLVSYSLTYETDTPGVPKGAQGTFLPASGQPVRKIIALGTCSQGICTYDSNPHNFTLVVTLEMTDGGTATKTLTKAAR